MKTFTNYAEKKAKQFLNLLQGYTKGIRLTAILILLLMGVSNAWAGEATIYVTGHIFKDSWDASKSEVRIGYNYNSDNGDQWTGHKSMTLTQYTYNGYPIYSYDVSSSSNWAQIYFYHYKDGQHFNSQQQDTGGWTEFTNNKNKVYVGWLDNDHRWVVLCEENTFYFLKNGNAANWTNVYAYAWSGSINNSWPGTLMTNTGKTYNGTPIYSVKLYCTYTTIIFNQGNGTNQSGDQATSGHEGKIFDYQNNNWIDYTYDVTTTHTVAFGVHSSGNGTLTAKAGSTSINSGAKVNQGSSITFTANPSTGYEVAGWYSNSGCTSAIAGAGTSTTYTINSLTAAATVYVKFQGKKYTVTLSNQGATTAGTASVQATYGSAMPSATMPTKTGYTFGGYYTSTNGGGTQYYKADGTSAKNWDKTSATTLHAKWTETKYNIQINVNGNGTTNQTGTKSIGIVGISATATPAAGYIFKNWTVTGGAHVSDANSATTTITATATGTVTANFEAVPTTIYLKPSSVWKQANARFAIYAFGGGSGDKWVDMTPVGCNDEYYMVDVPAGYTAFNFVRMNPATTENNWNNDWNQTGNLSIPDDGKNLYDMTKIYLEPNANWKTDAARFAAYFFNNDNNYWMSMSSSDGIYSCAFPPTDIVYDKVSFVRMKGDDGDNNWGNRLNQSKDIDLMSGYNQFTLEDGKWGKNDKGENDDNMNVVYLCKWTTLDLPKITITNNNPTYGDITVTTVGGTTITNGTEVDWDTQVIVSVQPKAGYAVESSSIDIGGNAGTIQSGKTYTICNNTTISVSFEEKGEWYIAGIDGNWEVREEYKFIDDRILLN